MNRKKVLIVAGLLLALALIYYLTQVRVGLRNAYAILGKKKYEGMDKGYLITWGKALKANKETFEFNGITYNAETGKLKAA